MCVIFFGGICPLDQPLLNLQKNIVLMVVGSIHGLYFEIFSLDRLT